MASSCSSEMLAPLMEANELLRQMEDTGKVDPSLVNMLSNAVAHTQKNQELWRTAGDVPKETAFVQYHAWRNVTLILTAMKNRFERAPAKHDNPQVAADAMDVMPSIFVTVNMLLETTPTQIGDKERSQILNRLRWLRAAALRSDMLPSLKEELAGVDMDEWRRRLTDLASAIGAELVEK